MEGLKPFGHFYKQKRVLVTGHTGFKGSWLFYCLRHLGANVQGYSLEAPSEKNHFSLINDGESHSLQDIRDRECLEKVFNEFRPELVFHFAAQPLVRRSYREKSLTYETNVMGSLNLIEAFLRESSANKLVIATSDKVYQQKEESKIFCEEDPLGASDPYSSSKVMLENLVDGHQSYLSNEKTIVTVRSGNVIGGGDWGEDRLIPDLIMGKFENKKVVLRNPAATRPWIHVLDSLSGYLILGAQKTHSRACYNLAPIEGESMTVLQVVQEFKMDNSIQIEESSLCEHQSLQLDGRKIKNEFSWRPLLNLKESLEQTYNWYQAYYLKNEVLTEKQWLDYLIRAKEKNACWI